MTEFILVRHGQTDWNVIGRYQGQTDIPLNETGLAQARALAGRMPRRDYAAIYSSDLSRAAQTAQALAEALGQLVRHDPRLREICQGEWEGKSFQQVAVQFADTVAEARANPLTARARGGESVLEVAARLGEAADAIARAHPAGPVIVVSHGFALAVLYCMANDIPLTEAYAHIPENTGLTVIDWQPGHAVHNLQADNGNGG